VVIATFLLTLTAPARADDTPTVQVTQVDNSRYPKVTIYVSVTGAGGQVVNGLQQADFKLTEDGAPVQITGFKGGGQVALATALVIDRSRSMDEEGKLNGAKQAALTFVDLMRPQDQAAVVAFARTARVMQPFTTNPAQLQSAIQSIDLDDSTAWRDALYQAVDLFATVTGRRAIIILTDGLDNASRVSVSEAADYAHRRDIPVYAIGLGARVADAASQATGLGGYDEQSLTQVAQQTAGKFYPVPTADQLKALYESLAVGMQHDYAITYRSPRPTNDGTRRSIDVTVGGATGGSQYLETHLLNVRSNALTGLLLILPLLVALIAPLAFTRRRAVPATVVRPVDPRPTAVAATCLKCHAPVRAEARFCAKCGTPYAPAPIAQPAPNVCPHCRKSLRPGAKFCNGCGAQLKV